MDVTARAPGPCLQAALPPATCHAGQLVSKTPSACRPGCPRRASPGDQHVLHAQPALLLPGVLTHHFLFLLLGSPACPPPRPPSWDSAKLQGRWPHTCLSLPLAGTACITSQVTSGLASGTGFLTNSPQAPKALPNGGELHPQDEGPSAEDRTAEAPGAWMALQGSDAISLPHACPRTHAVVPSPSVTCPPD